MYQFASYPNMMFRDVTAALCFLFLVASVSSQSENCNSKCGNLNNIKYPFRLSDDPEICGIQRYELLCQNNQALLNLTSKLYKVLSISYENQTIRLLNSGLQSNNCSFLPKYSLTSEDLGSTDFSIYYYYYYVTYLTCGQSQNDTSLITTSPCINSTSLSYSYVMLGETLSGYVPQNCTPLRVTTVGGQWPQNGTYMEIWSNLLLGFELSWWLPFGAQRVNPCRNALQSIHCFFYYSWVVLRGFGLQMLEIIGYILAARTGVALICLYSFVLYKLYKQDKALNLKMKLFLEQFTIYNTYVKHRAENQKIELFLEQCRDLKPTRYSYSEIRKMSRGLKDKLGQGGFGSVFKGILASGQPVAVKILSKTKGNGEDFINEVATIGRIHHVNVVQLSGFCSEGSKRALVYEYMPNGSIDKYIYSTDENTRLSLEKMYDIALGSARGIEYLHRGCDMQILHFDIKPQNILLDANFAPKVADFGLARLFPTEKSRVSVSAAKGTIGYIAPEVIYRKFGHVSYKADVYSFGRLLLEMIGTTRNLEVSDHGSSHLYIPALLYDQLLKDENTEVDLVMQSESKLAKVMLIVGLWCIQMRPNDRPSMHKVVEMLEGRSDDLPIPPRPNLAFPSDDDLIEVSVADTSGSLHLLDSNNSSPQ